MAVVGPRRFDVFLVALDPTVGSEMRKTRPCVVVSPDETNAGLNTVLVAPLTTVIRSYSFRVPLKFRGKLGQVAIDQLRVVDKKRLVKRLGTVPAADAQNLTSMLLRFFA